MAPLYTIAESEVMQPNQKLLKTQKSGCGFQLQSLCIQRNYSHCVYRETIVIVQRNCSHCVFRGTIVIVYTEELQSVYSEELSHCVYRGTRVFVYSEELQSLCIQRNYSHCVFRGLRTPLCFRCSGCMGSTCERRVSARRWCTRRSICCCCWGATRTRSRRPSPSSPPWGDSPPPRLSWLADVGTADSTPCSAVLPVWWWPFSGENVRAQRMSELFFFFFLFAGLVCWFSVYILLLFSSFFYGEGVETFKK